MNNPGRNYVTMKCNKLYVLFVSALILLNPLVNLKLFSQDINGKPEVSDYLKERLVITTDRDIYITGEQVWISIKTLNDLTNTPISLSKVVYVEFLDKNNFPLKQLKVLMEESSGFSGFIIPENTTSGNLVIRAYTNWMQNWPADQFCYKTISVVNPFENIENIKLQAKPFQKPEDGNQLPEVSDKKINFMVSRQKPEYSTREIVKMVIIATDMAGNPIETDLSVAVAKSGLIDSNGGRKLSTAASSQYMQAFNSKTIPDYLPELEGHLLSGNIKNKDTGEPLNNTGISLSYVGKTARCQFSKTDENGEFNFVVKETGVSEIVIQPLDPLPSGYYTDLRQSFNSNFSNYKPEPFYIDSNKIDVINNAIISMQIHNIYEPFMQNNQDVSKLSIPDFYGKPENTIRMADYIELTSLREVVREIIPNVYAQKQNGRYDFKLINKFRGHPFENKPLVLVDGVPIYDFEKVLNINSKEIERADIINMRYFYSEYVFDGILSFVTVKGNLSALEFDNTVFRQVYEACQSKKDFYSPDYSTSLMKESHIPDYRNTLFWKPVLHTGKDGKAEIEFYTSDEAAEYTIVLKGISEDGKTVYSEASLTVK